MNNQLKVEKLWNKNFILIFIANALASMNFFMLNPTFPVYIKEINDNMGVVGLLTSLFTLTAMFIRPIAGRVTDKYDRKCIFKIGIFLMCVSFAGYIFVHALTGTVITRVVHGIGWGLTTTALATLANDYIPLTRLGEGIGYYSASTIVAMAFGPQLGLEVMKHLGTSALFASAAGFTVLSAVTLSAVSRRKPDKNDTEPAASFSFSALFEKTALLPASTIFFVMIVASATATYLSLYATERGVENIGFFFTIQSVAVLISRPVSGRLVDKKGFDIVMVPSLIIMVVSMCILYIAYAPVIFMLSALIYGLGFGIATSTLQAMSVAHVKSDRRGAANGTYFVGVDMGYGLGTILAGYISNAIGYSMMYLLCIIPILLGLVLFLHGSRPKPEAVNQKAA